MNDGGPAFAAHHVDVITEMGNFAYRLPASQGMSLRDWFAGMALQGMLAANPQSPAGMDEDNVDKILAREAYTAADAMIAERTKKT